MTATRALAQAAPGLARMNELIAYLTDHCCMGKACAPSGRASRRATG